jgi:homoserine O-acetyltransferase
MLSARSDHLDIEVPLPAPLNRFGGSILARVAGRKGGPAIVALGGISGNRFVCGGESGRGWWPGLVGEGCAIDPAKQRVIGIDFAADPSGRTAPSTSDQAQVLRAALDAAGIGRVAAIVGASYGGMVALAFAQLFPAAVGRLDRARDRHAHLSDARGVCRTIPRWARRRG